MVLLNSIKMKKLLTILIILLSINMYSSDLETIRTVVEMLESQNDTDAVGDQGRAFGILQIHKICVDDVNRVYDTAYTHEEMFDPVCAREVYKLYIEYGIKLYESKFKEPPNEQQIVRMWNGGIYRGYKMQATIKYWKRYQIFKKQYESSNEKSIYRREEYPYIEY